MSGGLEARMGADGLRNLGRMGYPIGKIEAVFLTHFHSDHIDALGELETLIATDNLKIEALAVDHQSQTQGNQRRQRSGYSQS